MVIPLNHLGNWPQSWSYQNLESTNPAVLTAGCWLRWLREHATAVTYPHYAVLFDFGTGPTNTGLLPVSFRRFLCAACHGQRLEMDAWNAPSITRCQGPWRVCSRPRTEITISCPADLACASVRPTLATCGSEKIHSRHDAMTIG